MLAVKRRGSCTVIWAYERAVTQPPSGPTLFPPLRCGQRRGAGVFPVSPFPPSLRGFKEAWAEGGDGERGGALQLCGFMGGCEREGGEKGEKAFLSVGSRGKEKGGRQK